MRSEKGLRERKAVREGWVWLDTWPGAEPRGSFLLGLGFRFESGIGEDGRGVLTSEPQGEVAGAFRLGFFTV